MFGTNELPHLHLDDQLLQEMAKRTVNQRIAVTGVQPKLSLVLENTNDLTKRLTIVGLWGDYILKPQQRAIPLMPENEDLTMHLASIMGIKTAQHCLIPASDGQLAYIVKRFDREKGEKIHMEDFCQLGEFQTEQKYDSSYERCGKLIRKYCSNVGLDMVDYFQLLIFCFVSGNNDMHMKNFSVLHKDNQILLAPAYDLLNVQLIHPKDKEDMAMLLNGKRKELQSKDFKMLAKALHIDDKIFDRIISRYVKRKAKVFELIDKSFLQEDVKNKYKTIWTAKLAILEG